MGSGVDREDHLLVHVLQIRPENIQGQVVLLELFHHLLEGSSRLISPAALVVAHAPERREMAGTDVFVIAFKHRFGVVLAHQDQEVHLPPD